MRILDIVRAYRSELRLEVQYDGLASGSELVTSAYHRISGSIPVPLYCFDLWTIGHLKRKGLLLDYLKGFLRRGSEMLIAGMEAETPTMPAGLDERLIDAFREPLRPRIAS